MALLPKQLIQRKQQGKPIAMLTAWDWAIARLLDEAGVDIVLVGDSLAMVALGHATTLPLSLDQMIHHAQAVGRAVQRALIVCDLPFLSYQPSLEVAIQSAGRILQETPVQAVKLEGGYPRAIATVQALVEIGIPVMAHLGLTPQSVRQTGYRQQAVTAETQAQLKQQATALQAAGAFALLLEHIPADFAGQLTQELTIPTIGIGAGPHCDGQVLVTADLLGLGDGTPPFAKVYVDLGSQIRTAAQHYIAEVHGRQFPEA
jgi:3-methyl-2-oxobutanoate hydroxymethyltransferase